VVKAYSRKSEVLLYISWPSISSPYTIRLYTQTVLPSILQQFFGFVAHPVAKGSNRPRNYRYSLVYISSLSPSLPLYTLYNKAIHVHGSLLHIATGLVCGW